MTFSYGTLVLSVRTDHGVYLAADSRSVNPLANSRSDSAQKIFCCGGSAFIALTGTLSTRASLPLTEGVTQREIGTLDVMRILNQISNEYDGSSDLVEYAAGRSFGAIQQFWRKYVEPSPQAFLNSKSVANSICEMPVVQLRSGMIEVHEIKFPFSASGQLLEPTLEKRDEPIIAWGRVPDDADTIPQNVDSEASVLEYIDTIYEHATFFHPKTVGGYTDVGFIDMNGAHWIRRKRDLP